MDNYNEQPLMLTGGLTADELPEGRAIYDTNDKFNPNGKDLVNALSWMPTPVGGVASGADVWNQMRDQDVDPLLAGTVAAGVGALGTFGLGKLLKYLPKGKMGGYLRLGPRTKDGKNTILSDTGKKFEFDEGVDTKGIIDDANAMQKQAEMMDPEYLDMQWYANDDVMKDINHVPDQYINLMTPVDLDSYTGKLPDIPKDTIYHHFSDQLFNKPEKGYLGLRAGDNLQVGPTGGLYLTDEDQILGKFNHGYNVLGPSKDRFIDATKEINDTPILLDYINKTGLNRIWFDGLTNDTLVNIDRPYINRFLRKNGYAGLTDMHDTWKGRTNTPFREYATFEPSDTVIIDRIKNYNNPGVLNQ